MPIKKIALVVSHPIQHFCPQYASFAQNKLVEFKVLFASTLGLNKYVDPNFKKEIAWKTIDLNQFDHVFLNGNKLIASNKDIDAPGLDGELGSFKPDLVIIYGYFQKLQRRAHRWAKRHGVRLAYISDSELRQQRSLIKRWIKYLFIRIFFSEVNYFLSVGDANEEFYSYHGVKQIQMLRMHFPIDIANYSKSFEQKDSLRKNVREQYKIDEGEVVLSVVGKLVIWKNQDHIIKAIAMLEKTGIYCHLFIVGSGETEEFLQSTAKILSKSKVHFTGFVDVENLPAYYAATDIYVHPASVEPHSIAISEAIFMGCPVVVSNRSGSYGVTDDVQENKNGLVFEFGNVNELAAKLKSLIVDSDLRKRFTDHSIQISHRFQQQAHVGVLN